MILLKDESVKIMNEFDRKNRSAVMNLLTQRFSIPEFDADDIMQDAWLVLMDKLMVGDLPSVPEKLSAYLCKVCSLKAHEYLRKREFMLTTNISWDDESLTAERIAELEKEVHSWTDFLDESDRRERMRLELMYSEIDKLSPRQQALLMGYYHEDGSKAPMRELAQRLGYSTERVAITTRSRIMQALRTGIQQQERALGDGLSPVALFLWSQPPNRGNVNREAILLDALCLLEGDDATVCA